MKALIFLFLTISTVKADPVQTCNYVAGVAERVQEIRHVEQDSWPIFKDKVSKIYKNDEGLEQLLVIAATVYTQTPEATPANKVFDSVYKGCIKQLTPAQIKEYRS